MGRNLTRKKGSRHGEGRIDVSSPLQRKTGKVIKKKATEAKMDSMQRGRRSAENLKLFNDLRDRTPEDARPIPRCLANPAFTDPERYMKSRRSVETSEDLWLLEKRYNMALTEAEIYRKKYEEYMNKSMELKEKIKKIRAKSRLKDRKIARRDQHLVKNRISYNNLANKFNAQKKIKTLHDSLNYSHPDLILLLRKTYPELTTSTRMLTGRETLLKMEMCRMSYNQLEDERRFYRSLQFSHLASKRTVNEARKIGDIEIEEISKDFNGRTVSGARVKNIKELITRRIQTQIKHGTFTSFSEPTIEICVMGDHGQETTKLALGMNTIGNPNSPNSIATLALYDDTEDREKLEYFFGPLLLQLQELDQRTINVLDKSYQVILSMTGDLKFSKILMGLKAGNSKYYCLYCQSTKVTHCKYIETSISHIPMRKYGYLPERDQMFEPLLYIKPSQIRIPTLHIATGITNKIIKYMEYIINESEKEALTCDELMAQLGSSSSKDLERLRKLEDEEDEALYKVEGWSYINSVLNDEARSGKVTLPNCEIDKKTLEPCALNDCIVTKYKVPLPKTHVIPNYIQFDDTPDWYHCVCLGMTQYYVKKAEQSNSSTKPKHSLRKQQQAVEREYNAANELLQKKKKARIDNMELLRPKGKAEKLYYCLQKLGAYRTAWYKDYTGNHSRLIVTQIDKLTRLLTTEGIYAIHKIPECTEALRLFGEIQSYTVSRKLSLEEQKRIDVLLEDFGTYMKNNLGDCLPGHKLHTLIIHGRQQVKIRQDLGWLCEQGLESSHKNFKRLAQRITTRSTTKKLAWLLQEAYKTTTLYDICKIRLFVALYGHGFCTYLRSQMFRKLLRHGAAYFDEESHTPGRLVHKMITDTGSLNRIMGEKLDLLLPAVICSTVSITLALLINMKLALLCGFQFPAFFFFRLIELRETSKRQRKMAEEEKKVANLATIVLSNMGTIKAYGLQDHFDTIFRNALKPMQSAMTRQACISAFVFACQFSFTYILIAITLFFGKDMMIHNEIDPFDYLRVVLLTQFGANFISQLIASVTDFSKARVAAENILSVITEPATDMDNLSDEGLRPKVVGRVSLHNVEFRYPSRPIIPVLKDVTMNVGPGMNVAIVGPSGSGKSSIIALLQRMYSPQKGQVMLDKYNVKTINPAYLRRIIVCVGQEPTLFSFSIKENIAYGLDEDEYTMVNVIEAAKIANIHDFIVSLPRGYDTEVGEYGAQLSGGQKQRIAIARAMIRKPVVLLLDEATAALDATSEKAVQQAVEKASESCTCIHVAHHLASIRTVDKIFVVVDGKITEQGTHQQLMAEEGLYYEMNQLEK